LGHGAPQQAPSAPVAEHKPFVPADQDIPEFTPKAIVFGSLFGILFGASTVYLALKAGLTVSASIPIAVLSISVLRLFGRGTILENNIVQTIGSAGESVAAGVAFTIPALLFLSPGANGEQYFEYVTIMTLAACGGILGVLFMVPLRRSLIVAEHGTLPYPEGTACADVLVAGEKGGRMAGLVFGGVAVAAVYKLLNSVLALWHEAVQWVTSKTSTLPNATVANEVSPEYLGVGYILGPRVGGIMVSGSVLTFIVMIPMLSLVLTDEQVISDLMTLGYSQSAVDGMSTVTRFREAYTRYIGAGAVTMAGIITLIRTMPTIVRSLRESMSALKKGGGSASMTRTERDIPITWVAIGSVALAGIMAVLPILPGDFGGKLLMAVLMLVFGFLFVTVSSRIVGLIGSSSNPISGMTIATLLGTALVFLSFGMSGDSYQPIALSVGAIVCIAAANAGATSQDLKTGFLVGATPIRQQIGLVIGVVVSTFVIGLTLKFLNDSFTIGSDKFPAPQANLMATVIKGVMSQNLPWGYILVGAGLSLMVYLCGVSPLAWAVGAYLPISTTLPIFLGGALRWLSDKLRGEKAESELSPGMLFATGLVAGGTLTGVATSVLKAIPTQAGASDLLTDAQGIGASFQESVGLSANLLALIPYTIMAVLLVRMGMRKMQMPGRG
jgi:putative OPT family oligopeptide transporter